MNKPLYTKIIKSGKLSHTDLIDCIDLENIKFKLYDVIKHITEKLDDKSTDYQSYRPEITKLKSDLERLSSEYSAHIFPMMMKKAITLKHYNKKVSA